MREIEQIPQLPAPREKQWQDYLIDSLLAVVGVAAVTVIIYAYHLYPTIPNISLVYLLLILGMGLLVIMLGTVFFVFTGSIVALFATIAVLPLCYWCVDRYLNISETSASVT